MKRLAILLAALLVAAVPLFARGDFSGYQAAPRTRLLTQITDEPAWFWMTWWVDAGNVSDISISNTLQGGFWGRHPNDERPYDFLPSVNSINSRKPGFQFEYPKGSDQTYGWAFGIWVGAEYPAKITGGDTTWSPNVTKGGFYTDMGAMAAPEMAAGGSMGDISNRGLYFSDGVIPPGYNFEGEGNQLYAQAGQTPLPYQTLWPFADTSVNKYRRELGMPEVDPDSGDIISQQDTYACGGDWIPAKDAAILWIRTIGGPYDVWGLGVRIEQRTYAWNYEYNDSYVFFNFKIQNMNDFPLKNVYLSWFMDNDIGDDPGGTSPGDPGAWDDLIGFNHQLNMGYTYDSDGSEEGWVTPAGYIGAVLVETPYDLGLTGFETWRHHHEVDDDGTDSIKYTVFQKSTDFVTREIPDDVRMLLNCGPIPELPPHVEGDPSTELNITICCIVAYTYDELAQKANAAIVQFNNGYFGYAPPPNPALTVIPGDSMVYLTWSADPENFIDPMSGLATFEGYRVYKSLTGLAEDWQLLADYDLSGSANSDTAVALHTVGTSKATISYEGFHVDVAANPAKVGFEDNIYTITFQEDSTQYFIYDVGELKLLSYNEDALNEGGFCVLDELDGEVVPLEGAEKAAGTLTFTGDTGSVVPEGTRVSTDTLLYPVVYFVTTDEATIDSGQTSVDVAAEAEMPGDLGNVNAGQISTFTENPPAGITSVTNSAAFTGGFDGDFSPPHDSLTILLIDGSQYIMANGVFDPEEEGAPLVPRPGEQFTINTYAGSDLGGQTGIRHFYIDEDVHNGQNYYYSVTSYSRAQPTENVGSLEGGKTGQSYWAIPRSNPLGWEEAYIDPHAYRVAGTGNALVTDSIVAHELVTGHEYEVGFKADETGAVRYAFFKDVDENETILDDFIVRSGELSGPIIDGVLVQVAAISVDTLDVETQIDSLQTGWLSKPSGTNLDGVIRWPGHPGPVPVSWDLLITVEPGTDVLERNCPVTVKRYPGGQSVDFIWNGASETEVDSNDIVNIYRSYSARDKAFDLTFVDTLPEDSKVELIPPEDEDEYLIKTLKPTTTDVRYRYQTHTAGIDESDTVRTLDDVRVVPNPYYIRAEWDRSRYDQHVYFQNLPLICTIRIFNSAGLLIRTIEHDGTMLDGIGDAGSQPWDLRTEEDLECMSGLYIWQVEAPTPDGGTQKKTGKFAIVR